MEKICIAVFVDIYMFYNLLLSLHTTSIPVTGMEDLECKTWEIMSVRNTIFVRLELISLRLGFRRNFLSVSSSSSRFKAYQRYSGNLKINKI